MNAKSELNTICVLMVVDVEGAIASGNLNNNLWLVDTTGYMGALGEGTNELVTVCTDGQVITWSVQPVDPNTAVSIVGFSGQMTQDKICVPQQYNNPSGPYWSARVEAQGFTGRQQYSATLSFEGKQMSFDPFLQIQ